MTPDLNTMAQDILRATNDGDDLADQDHLLLLRVAAGTQTNAGYDAVRRLHERVMAGTYGKEERHGQLQGTAGGA